MNPWDLSCRSRVELPLTAKQFHEQRWTVNEKGAPVASRQLSLASSLSTADILATYSVVATATSTAPTITTTTGASLSVSSPSSSSSSCSPSFYSLSSSPASSRSNSSVNGETNDAIEATSQHLDPMALASGLTNMNPCSIQVTSSSANDISCKALANNQMNPPLLDRKARKKDQNRRAAYNYRRKKIEEKNRMREEEMRLVYSRVCLIGYAEELESSIMYILNTKTKKILDKDGKSSWFLCPVCLRPCDNTMNLRNHLNMIHYPNIIC